MRPLQGFWLWIIQTVDRQVDTLPALQRMIQEPRQRGRLKSTIRLLVRIGLLEQRLDGRLTVTSQAKMQMQAHAA